MPQIATRYSDICVIIQLAFADLRLGDSFKACPVQVVVLHALLRRGPGANQTLEYSPWNKDAALEFAHRDAEFDRLLGLVPARVVGEREDGDHTDDAIMTSANL